MIYDAEISEDLIERIRQVVDSQQTWTDKLRVGLDLFYSEVHRATRSMGSADYTRVTELGGCVRLPVFRRLGLAQDSLLDAETLRKMEAGEQRHEALESILERLGLLVERELEMESDELQLRGKADGLLPDGTIVEIKTVSDSTVDAVLKYGKKFFFKRYQHYVAQGIGYILLTEAPRVIFVLEGHESRRHVFPVFEPTKDDKIAILDKIEIINDAVARNVLPIARFTKFCSRCPFGNVCGSIGIECEVEADRARGLIDGGVSDE